MDVPLTADPDPQDSPPPPPILRLSPHIRRRIYLHVGVASWDGCSYVFDLHGRNNASHQPTGNFHGLLLSCRTIYAEASALLYSADRFFLRYWHKRSLQPLRTLTAPSLASLASLKIVLNETSCHQQSEHEGYSLCCDGWDTTSEFTACDMYKHSHDLPLNGSDSLAKAMLTEWQATAAHLSSYVSSKSLELSLVCDIDCENEDVAKLAVAPLLFLSPLKNCHVRLCGKPNAQLQQVAEDAVLQARNISPSILSPLATALRLSSGSSSSSPSPSSLHRRHLLNLPRELRFCILNYTDLVAPRKEVTWSRQHSGYLPGKASCADRQGRGQKCPPAIHHGCQFSRCWDNAYSEYSSIGCFCRRRHASSSSACRCWAPPTALFLVCRTLCEDARVVFFSNNRFVVHEFQSHPPRAMPPLVGNDYSYERFAASQFLRDIVPADCLRELRFLELVFAPYSPQAWPRDGHAALQDWSETIDWIKDKTNAAGLTLRLVMGDAPHDRKPMTWAEGNAVLAGHKRILGPLARLGGGDGGNNSLRRFYVQVTWPAWPCDPRADGAPVDEASKARTVLYEVHFD